MTHHFKHEDEPRLAVVRKVLPPPAMKEFVDAANVAVDEGLEHSECIRAGWDQVNIGWEKRGRHYGRKKGRRPDRRADKGDPGPSDVHTVVPLGGTGAPKPKKKPLPGEAEVKSFEVTEKRTLYVSRSLLNGDDVRAWAAEQGFESALPADDMHVTIAFSKAEVDWSDFTPQTDTITIEGGDRSLVQFPARLTANGATVLKFSSSTLTARWQEFLDEGASWDFPEYQPHITITYQNADGVEGIEPYDGPLVFGPEQFDEIRQDLTAAAGGGDKVEFEEEPLTGQESKAGARHSRTDQAQIQAAHDAIVKAGAACPMPDAGAMKSIKAGDILKIDEEQRIVYGWASVISVKGEPVIDLQDDIIPPDELEKSTTEFMLDHRKAMEMHERRKGPNGEPIIHDDDIKGAVVHSFPLTAELMKSLGIYCEREGWIVGVKVNDDTTWKRVKSGELKAFSWGGTSG